MLDLAQIRFCAEECRRQESGEMSVYWMCCGLSWVMAMPTHSDSHELAKWDVISHEGIQELARIIEPKKNANGYRMTPILIGSTVKTADNLRRAMDGLILYVRDHPREPETFYQEFETIHPFIDGNGRVGALLFNYLFGTLEAPIAPPEYVSRRD